MRWPIAAAGLYVAGLASAQAQPPIPYGPVPPPQEEIVPPPPGGRFVWEPGHWFWNGRQYVWAGGRYVVARPHYRHWAQGRWIWGPREGRWIWRPAHWE
jgi:hypothetical protein